MKKKGKVDVKIKDIGKEGLKLPEVPQEISMLLKSFATGDPKSRVVNTEKA